MNEKLVLQDIVDALAKKTSLSKKEADTFFREFFAAIIDNIFNDEPVKIKDFGTFKLVMVDSRESVDVNTGEKIEIPAHAKISFLPDKVLKTLVNKPFAHFEITPLSEGVTFDIEESEEPAELQDDDTAIDEPEIVKSIAKPTPPEPKKPEQTPAETLKRNTPAAVAAPVIPVSQSFVYTYTADTKEEDKASVTIVLPADKIVGEIAASVAATTTPVEEQPAEKEASLEVNKVQEKIGQLKGAIEALSKVKNQTQEPVVPVVIEKEEVEEPAPPVEVLADEPAPIVLPEALDKVVFDEIDLLDEEDKEAVAAPEPVSEEPDDDELVDYDYQYPDYHKQTLWMSIRKKLPIIVFLLAIIGFGVYGIYAIMEENNKIGRQRGYNNFSQTGDSLATENTPLPPAVDSQENKDSAIDADVEDEHVTPPATGIDDKPKKDNVAASITDNASSAPPNESGVVISERLKIAVPDKAAYLQNRNTGSTGVPAPPTGNTSALVETIKPGASLLSIAQTYYKNRIFWVYIYEENKAQIGADYDNISAGDRLVIPAPKKYGIDPDNPESVAKAKELEKQIHASKRKR